MNKYSKLISALKSYDAFENNTFAEDDYLWAGYIYINDHEDGVTLYNTLSKDSMGEDKEICTFYYRGVANISVSEDSRDFYKLDLVAHYFDGSDALRKAFEEAGIQIC